MRWCVRRKFPSAGTISPVWSCTSIPGCGRHTPFRTAASGLPVREHWAQSAVWMQCRSGRMYCRKRCMNTYSVRCLPFFRHRIPTTSTPLHRWAFRSLPMPWTLSGMRMSTGNESCGNWNRPNVPLMPPRICSGTRTASRYCPRAESGCSAAMRKRTGSPLSIPFLRKSGTLPISMRSIRSCGGSKMRWGFPTAHFPKYPMWRKPQRKCEVPSSGAFPV